MRRRIPDEELLLLPVARQKHILRARNYNQKPEVAARVKERAKLQWVKDKQKEYRARPEIRDKRVAKYREDPTEREKSRWRTILSRFGVTEEQWFMLFESQGSKCACCGSTDPRHAFGWALDHDKITLKIRGIVCHECNTVLGRLGDQAETAREKTRQYLIYLEREPPNSGQAHPVRQRRRYREVRRQRLRPLEVIGFDG